MTRSERTRLAAGDRVVDTEEVGELTRALRREAEYATWEAPPGRRITLPQIDDVGEVLGDARWDGWAVRRRITRLADDPRVGHRRFRVEIRIAIPGWFATLLAVYVDALPATLAATRARQVAADARAVRLEERRSQGATIEGVAALEEVDPATVKRARRRVQERGRIS